MGGIPIFSYYLVMLWYRLRYLFIIHWNRIPKYLKYWTRERYYLVGNTHVEIDNMRNCKMSATRPELVKKSGTKSAVWDFFGLEQGRDGKPINDGSVICCSCCRRVIARSGYTSNLLVHLKANLPKIYYKAKESMSTKERPRSSTIQLRPSTSLSITSII